MHQIFMIWISYQLCQLSPHFDLKKNIEFSIEEMQFINDFCILFVHDSPGR